MDVVQAAYQSKSELRASEATHACSGSDSPDLEPDSPDLEPDYSVYKTWPDRQKSSPRGDQTKLDTFASLSSLDQTGSKPPTCDKLPPPGAGVPHTHPMTMAAALESLSISYSPSSKGLHAVVDIISDAKDDDSEQTIKSDENDSKNVYYKPGHRKAYSLPRTLEVVDEHGSITHPMVEHDVVVESPRSTLLRYGLPYKPYNFDGESSNSSMSEMSGMTDHSATFASENSSHEDSGIFSDSSAKIKQTRKGLTDFFSKGLGVNWKMLSKSGQQMVKMVRKDTIEVETESPCVSSQSLIMEHRPPGVPAKSVEEEEKHRQEHKILMEKLKKKEQSDGKNRAHKLAEQRRVEDDLSQLTSHWSANIMPNWSTMSSNKKTQALWWKGLPPPVRGRVWKLALSNTLNLTPQLYKILVSRAQEQLENKPSIGAGSRESREETLELIQLDVSRTFPQLCIFQTGGPYYQLLHNVLGAYVCYRPDIGYVQGMSFIAAILILNLDEAEAFIVFANLINWPLLAAFYSVEQEQMERYYSTFSSHLSSNLPSIASHFSRLGLRPDLYILDWWMTLFSKCAPLDITCRIWDLLIRDGEEFLFRAGLGILSLYEDRLLAESDFILLAQFLSKLPDNLDGDKLFEKIEEISLGPGKRTFSQLALW
eukprot:GFUD01001914.1.p1 GENE.GFUD01001914.1~~GFUD01001914.1.p1  ORF type:complete len:652 (-),score=231.78 GFUD01001914.1:342-2297(-)